MHDGPDKASKACSTLAPLFFRGPRNKSASVTSASYKGSFDAMAVITAVFGFVLAGVASLWPCGRTAAMNSTGHSSIDTRSPDG
jgi:hypothetical protein